MSASPGQSTGSVSSWGGLTIKASRHGYMQLVQWLRTLGSRVALRDRWLGLVGQCGLEEWLREEDAILYAQLPPLVAQTTISQPRCQRRGDLTIDVGVLHQMALDRRREQSIADDERALCRRSTA